MTTNSEVEINNRIQNLCRNLQKDPKSVFYLVGNLSNSVLNKASKSFYEKDKVFVSLYNHVRDKNFQKIVTPSINIKSNVDHSTLFSMSKPFDRFLARSVFDPKYSLSLVDLFTSKIYFYRMKNRSVLAKKLELFYEDIKQKTQVECVYKLI